MTLFFYDFVNLTYIKENSGDGKIELTYILPMF